MGDLLADEVKKVLEEHRLSVDVVIPVNNFGSLLLIYYSYIAGSRYVTCSCAQPGAEVTASLSRRLH